MFRHYFIAAIRNMAANRLQTAIAVFGLTLGLTAAILAALVVRNELTYDSFLPGHEQIFAAGLDVEIGGRAPIQVPSAPHEEAAKLANIPGVAAVARLCNDYNGHALSHGQIEGADRVFCADPNIFDLLEFPVLYGDLKSALMRPDTIVIPLSVARKYFGMDNAVGQILIVDGKHPMRVAAVLADLPFNHSNFDSAIFVSGKAAWTDLAQADAKARDPKIDFIVDNLVFVRLAPGVSSAEVEARMRAQIGYLLPHPATIKVRPHLFSLAAMHMDTDGTSSAKDRLAAFTAVALLILVLSVINFLNLTTARGARRGLEVGARKALGASRKQLMAQFLGEAVIQALIALLLSMVLLEWVAGTVSAKLGVGAALDYGRYGWVLLALLGGTVLVGLAGGFYPALVLSSFRPARVLKGGPLGVERAGFVRQGLVILQFCILAALGIGAGIFVTQYNYALTRTVEGADRMLFVQVPTCEGAFKDKMATLPEVTATACTDASFVKDIQVSATAKLPGGGTVALATVTAGPGLLEMYGQPPIAGRDLNRSDDVGSDEAKADGPPVHVVVNQLLLRKLGISSPEAAIGHAMRWDALSVPIIIVGVVRDFSTYALEKPIQPTAYIYREVASFSPMVALKLRDGSHAGLLNAVDENWRSFGGGGIYSTFFLRDWISRQRQPLLLEAAALGGFAFIAMLLGCLGLFGLSLSTAQRRTKEIGIRKAMGAGRRDMLGLLLWQFARPVLWANLIAWPIAFWAMNRWLNGFAYHVAMPLWIFPAVGAVTLLVALLTVLGQALLVARQKPVLALRYE